jgi:putative membrane protein
MSKIAVVRKKSLAKGLVAGLIGGLIATAAKTFAERMFPPRAYGEPDPTDLIAERVAGHELTPATKTAKEGASFGLALGTLTHGTALPALGLSAEPEDQTVRERTSEMTSHVVYGVVTEMVRGFVRRFL